MLQAVSYKGIVNISTATLAEQALNVAHAFHTAGSEGRVNAISMNIQVMISRRHPVDENGQRTMDVYVGGGQPYNEAPEFYDLKGLSEKQRDLQETITSGRCKDSACALLEAEVAILSQAQIVLQQAMQDISRGVKNLTSFKPADRSEFFFMGGNKVTTQSPNSIAS